MNEKNSTSAFLRRHFSVGGIVQGVGFRPFVYRIAHKLSLTGWVRNTPAGVEIEVQGNRAAVEHFGKHLFSGAPPLAVISSCEAGEQELQLKEERFVILPSSGGMADIQIAPDSDLCPDCLRELFNPADRRYRYPFITCTNCGPRYSIITAIPYDRPNTTMAGFPLCPACRTEYEDPGNRRFHAEPLACPECGPSLQLLDAQGVPTAGHDEALCQTQRELKAGKIVAIKGIGGYHLALDATNHAAVERLRERKKRDEKPFALMVSDLAAANDFVALDELEARLLTSPEAPIVILRSKGNPALSRLVAPGNGWLGIMLPYTPLHHLLFQEKNTRHPLFSALIMTSANSSDEPILFRDSDAVEQISAIADYILTHNRPINARSDDSVLRVFQGKPLLYRRSRGYAPRAIAIPFTCKPILAVGAELKSTICLTQGNRAVLSQHIGDLQNDPVRAAFQETIVSLSALLQISPELIACDLHPDYLSSVYAAQSGLPLVTVQHHHAHMAACMAENGLEGEVIGLIFDGTGYGSDGTLWGGEILTGGYAGFKRSGHFRPARLPGGDAAVRQPWRMALSYLYQTFGNDAFTIENPVARRLTHGEQKLFAAMLERGINSPWSSSCGRLFDAVAALLDVRQNVSYDGQAAIELEALAESADYDGTCNRYPYALSTSDSAPFLLDFSGVFPAILDELKNGTPRSQIARRFHETVAEASITACLHCSEQSELRRVVLSGGVFQNRLLTEMLYTGLTKHGLQVFTHRLTPPNDGCIPLGQAAVAGWQHK